MTNEPVPGETVLHTKRCVLRPWHMDDAPFLPPIANTRNISWNTSFKFPYPYDEAAARKYIRYATESDGESWLFAIERDGALIGGCGCERGTDVFTHTAETGYWLDVAQWGQGIATEALEALVGHMTEATDVERLSATVFGWNPASRRVLEKCGFVNEGIRKNGVSKWGKTADLWLYGLQLR